jgi:hypothetical protein
MPFQIDGTHGWRGVREFVNYADRLAFLERKLMGLVCMGTGKSKVHDHKCRPVPIHTFRELLICFSNVKSITYLTLELVHQVGGWMVMG